jgi:hypothetical protein
MTLVQLSFFPRRELAPSLPLYTAVLYCTVLALLCLLQSSSSYDCINTVLLDPRHRPFFSFHFLRRIRTLRSYTSADLTDFPDVECIYILYLQCGAKQGGPRKDVREYMDYTVLHSTTSHRQLHSNSTAYTSQTLFLVSFDSIPVLARNYFYLWCRNCVVRFHLERRIFHEERPHIVAQTIGMEMTLLIITDD